MYFYIILLHLVLPNQLMIDFKEREKVADWYIINDGVMGGLSKGKAMIGEDGLLFYGTVSLDNNGGFTSLRSPYSNFNLTPYSVVEIKYRSKGVRQAFQMEVDRRFYLPNYKVPLKNTEDWTIVRIQLEEVKQYRMGSKTGRLLESDALDEIIRVGFITDEKRAGDFTFEVAYIKFE